MSAPRQHHAFGRGGGLVEHRGVGDGHAGEVADHRLEVHQRLEPALADLGLVRRVRGVPGRVLEDVALDDAGRVRAVVALADEALQHPVLGGDAAQLGQCLRLGGRRRQVHRLLARDARRDDARDQLVARGCADGREHAPLFGVVGADVAAGEFGRVLQLGQRVQGGHRDLGPVQSFFSSAS
jgi:hypothetical protein